MIVVLNVINDVEFQISEVNIRPEAAPAQSKRSELTKKRNEL